MCWKQLIACFILIVIIYTYKFAENMQSVLLAGVIVEM